MAFERKFIWRLLLFSPLLSEPRHGFVLIGGLYTAVNFPNATGTQALEMNDLGEIVGMYFDAAGNTHGFHAVKQ
jgi:hypothetical protein